MNYKLPLASMFALALAGCGGGGGSSGSTPPPPVTITPPAVAAISPATATVGVATTFSVTGTDLTDALKFTLDNCDGITQLAGGTKLLRQFSCTPGGAFGAHSGNVYASAAATASLRSVVVDFQSPILNMDNSASRYVVISSSGRLYSWGASFEQGDGDTFRSLYPIIVGEGYASVSVGMNSTLAIKKDGTLWAWGENYSGTLGTGKIYDESRPVQIGTGYQKVVNKGAWSDDYEYAVGLKTDGSLWVWGARTAPEANSLATVYAPRMIGTGYSDIVGGSEGDMLALKADGSLWQFERNPSPTPFTPVKIADGYVAVTTNWYATIGLKADGTLWNWGPRAANKPATGTATAANPVLVGEGFKSISGGRYYTMAFKKDGTLWAGGENGEGQFGDGTTSLSVPFRQVVSGFIAVAAGDQCTIGEKPDGTIWAWGFCQFGDGAEGASSLVPRKISLP